MTTQPAAFPDLFELVHLFYPTIDQLGQFQEVERPDNMPAIYRRLLNHEAHMTVTVESHHGCPVDVRVIQDRHDGDVYLRKIMLTRQSDGLAVQFGIVRLHVHFLAEQVRREIESRKIPLGRVLIQHNVLRRVELSQLWRVSPGTELCSYFGLESPQTTFGRTAIIHCDHEPAVELLEIVRPEPTSF